ncbi:Curculin domain protein (mannose-binding) lectin [Trichosporon asahii var. asahii CBS 8904]|uniref:Curculin domain protein (Mannose-binding) lectin n=1 Tax=Trichosporon asahii var. asahii (strain CBS 8904) TaxID=1220162 RepID=K1VJA0_TRIAC|nr:Curculin domain protein (mannose-binding) lectin [Trichosporon asahii var. asahii CBS 8904]
MRLTALATLIAPLAALSALAAPTPDTINLATRDEADVIVGRALASVDPSTTSVTDIEREISRVEVGAHALVARDVGKDAFVTANSGIHSIQCLQYLLTARGFRTDRDGILGADTIAQIKAFQKSKGLTVDGSAGPATLSALIALVESGDTGVFAKAAQKGLNKFGAKLEIDGIFGASSVAATKKLQTANGLTASGKVGGSTWSLFFGGAGKVAADCDNVKASVAKSATTLVGDFRVHKCLASNLKAMLAAAKADGVTLSHRSSYRSTEEQIAIRKQYCGTTHYDIYEKPSNQCSPHAAPPGTTRHERGLAIDFLNCRDTTACFKWLSAHAAKYHFKNYPPENWHWSYDGY